MFVVLLSEIRRGVFKLDLTRSGFIVPSKKQRVRVGDDQAEQAEEEDGVSESSSSSSESSDDCDGDLTVQEDEALAMDSSAKAFDAQMRDLMLEQRLLQHSSSGMIHISNGERLACGRLVHVS